MTLASLLNLKVLNRVNTYMDPIWKVIKQDVQNKNWNTTGLQELFEKQLDVMLIKHSIKFDRNKKDHIIERNGDIVVRFYLDDTVLTPKVTPTPLQLTIGGVPIPDLEIHPGEFVYVFENTHIYPIISVSYSDLRIKTIDCDGLYVVYALIRDDFLRRELATNDHILKFKSGKIARIRGCFGYIEKDSEILETVPDMTTL